MGGLPIFSSKEPDGRCRLRFDLLANGIALEIEGCRGKEPLQMLKLWFAGLLLLLPVNPIKGYWLPVDNRTAVFRLPS